METSGTGRKRGRVYPLAASMTNERWRRRSTHEMRRNDAVPWLIHRMRPVVHVVRLIKPRAIPVQMKPRTVDIAPSALDIIRMLLILIRQAERPRFLLLIRIEYVAKLLTEIIL